MVMQWHYAVDASAVDEEDVVQVVIDNRELAVYRLGEEFYATEDACTHGQASLSEGVVIDGVIECPLHQGRFCIRTGKPRGGPVSVPLRTFPTRQEGGKVFIRIDAET